MNQHWETMLRWCNISLPIFPQVASEFFPLYHCERHRENSKHFVDNLLAYVHLLSRFCNNVHAHVVFENFYLRFVQSISIKKKKNWYFPLNSECLLQYLKCLIFFTKSCNNLWNFGKLNFEIHHKYFILYLWSNCCFKMLSCFWNFERYCILVIFLYNTLVICLSFCYYSLFHPDLAVYF